jgi:reverse transcriptase-like protein
VLVTWQVYINNVLKEHLDEFIFIYIDNILIFLENMQDYIGYIKIVLDILKKVNLRLEPLKLEFHIKEIKFMEYIVGKNRL